MTSKFTLQLPENYKEIFKYSLYIILAGSASAILLDIDKVMLPQKEAIEFTAYYTVGVFIASVIEAPGRAMSQILQPLTSKAIHEDNINELKKLYKKSSINLLLVCGLFFLLINLNITELYQLLPEKYSGGVFIVLMISVAKLYIMFLGNNGAIISNSKYYKVLLPYGIAMALSVAYLNVWLIDLYGMNGAALSTLLVILVFNTIKIWYVKIKFDMLPFTKKSFVLMILIVSFYTLFIFWNFDFHPIINIGLKSGIIIICYLLIVYKLKISTDINQLILKFIKYNQ